jgi:hypothetical protein
MGKLEKISKAWLKETGDKKKDHRYQSRMTAPRVKTATTAGTGKTEVMILPQSFPFLGHAEIMGISGRSGLP